MLKHYLTLVIRNFKRHKDTFLINLLGLASGLACALMIYLWINDERSIDKFHEKDAQLFQVMISTKSADGVNVRQETAPVLAETLLDEIPEIEQVATEVLLPISYPLIVQNQVVKSEGAYASSDYFKLFSYELTKGNKDQVLADKGNIVISTELSKKLFGNEEDVLGRPISIDEKGDFQVAGVFKTPEHATRDFEFVIPMATMFDHFSNLRNDWSSSWVNTFVLLQEDARAGAVSSKIKQLLAEKSGQKEETLFLRKFSDAYLYGDYENGHQAGGRIQYVRLFGIIALFVLVIASINFMNLSTAKASQRLKEIRVKKAIGAERMALVRQYLLESIMMSFLAFAMGLLIVWIVLPQFNDITSKQLLLNFQPQVWGVFLLITLLTGLLAGSYPAIYLSGMKPVAVSGKNSHQHGREIWIRKGLIIFQFVMSIVLTVSVLMVYRQIELIQNKQLGYDKENVLYFPIEGTVQEHLDGFLEQVQQIDGVWNASSMFMTFFGNINGTSDVSWPGKSPETRVDMEYRRVNYGLTGLLNMEMVAGRSYDKDYADSTSILFNEAAIAAMGLEEPVGKKIRLWGKEREIIGVVKDFHFQSFHEKVKPLFLFLNPERTNYVALKIAKGKEEVVIKELQAFYKTFNPGFSLDYHFLDQVYQEQYRAEKRVSVLSKYFAVLAILISCLGLFGLAVFSAEKRRKEIGVRKVLGASIGTIVKLMTGEFARLILVSIAIATPLAWWASRQWLAGFAYRTSLDWWVFTLAGLLVMLIAMLTVGTQAFRAARVNPVNSLRSE